LDTGVYSNPLFLAYSLKKMTDHVHPLHNLPTALNTFIGRQREIATVRRLLPAHRLLTLTGPGGCGKTRLALKVAGEVASTSGYADGVWLVELAALSAEDQVAQAAATVLQVREQSQRPISDLLVDYLQPRTALLIFDNCEHLVASSARLCATLRQRCPGVSILTTSREPLGISGEMVWAVPPLSLSEPRPWRSPANQHESLAVYQQSEAIQLFLARATAVSPMFTLTDQNGPWIADICRRLDGLPLAIELAAARVRTLSVQQIAHRLDGRFQLLTNRLRTAPARHQTLTATLDWSHALLSDVEQVVFRRLAVFANGCTLEAAEAVGSGDGVSVFEVVNVLSNLADKSLVVVEEERDHGRWRYRLLETIRQYARQKLGTANEMDRVQARRLDYFVTWAEAVAAHLTGPDQSAWLAQFDAEYDNLRAALDWSYATDRVETGLRLARSCGQFWRLHSYFSEGRSRLAKLLAHPGAQQRTLGRAWGLLWAANLAYLQSDYPATRPLAEEGLSICRELGPDGRSGVAKALDLLGELATEVGEYEVAPVLLAEALAIYQELGDTRGRADMLMQLGWAAMRAGDYEQADTLLHESLPLFEELGEAGMLALVLAGLGELAVRQGRYDTAGELLEKSLAQRQELGDQWGMAVSLGSLGWVALRQRNFDQMRDRLAQSLAIRREIDDRSGMAWCLEKLGEAVIHQAWVLPATHSRQLKHRAARLFGAAAALRQPLNSVIDPVDQPEYDRSLKKLRRALGKTAFDVAWREGQQAPLPETIDLALRPVVADTAVSLPKAAAMKVKFGGLTPRERETARWIAQGKTNREIAEIMIVSEKTIETYVTRSLNKLGFSSRVQIARWALENNLLESDSDSG
jgi:predicted ATPase/DNA-binding CsgD family transcriptional regulator